MIRWTPLLSQSKSNAQVTNWTMPNWWCENEWLFIPKSLAMKAWAACTWNWYMRSYTQCKIEYQSNELISTSWKLHRQFNWKINRQHTAVKSQNCEVTNCTSGKIQFGQEIVQCWNGPGFNRAQDIQIEAARGCIQDSCKIVQIEMRQNEQLENIKCRAPVKITSAALEWTHSREYITNHTHDIINGNSNKT